MRTAHAGPEIAVEEYLSNPVYEHCEYIDGRPVELNVGGKRRSRIQVVCASALLACARGVPNSYGAIRLHCHVAVGARRRFYLPDVAVVLNDTQPENDILRRAPDFVVEIRSPDDSIAWLTEKMSHYFANGARLAWLILPEEESVLVFTPDAPPRVGRRGDLLDGGSVLPALSLPVAELFG